MGVMTYQITSLTIFSQPFIQTQIIVNIKARVTGLKFTVDRRIPRTNGQ